MIMDSGYMCYHKKNNSGISLIEILIYVALLGALSVFVTNSLIQIAGTYGRVRAEREVLAGARTVLDAVAKSTAAAEEVYTSTSRFNSDTGQLSLVTVLGATPGHTTAYVDFWVDGGRALSRAEGGSPTTLTVASVRVVKFRFERLVQGLGREAIKATVQVDSANPRFPASVTLNATTALRGNY